MKRILLLAAIVAPVTACVTTQTPAKIGAPFDVSVAETAMKPGRNTVKGFAVLRTVGGDAKTCAGEKVNLTPATAYAAERMSVIYGSTISGQRTLGHGEYRTGWNGAERPVADYSRLAYTTVCDAQGKFEFSNVGDGDWYVVSTVYWEVGGRPQGGYLMRRVTVGGGQTINVALTGK